MFKEFIKINKIFKKQLIKKFNNVNNNNNNFIKNKKNDFRNNKFKIYLFFTKKLES